MGIFRRSVICFFCLLCLFLCGCGIKETNVKINEDSKIYLAAVEELEDYFETNAFLYRNSSKGEWKNSLNNLKEDIKSNKINESDFFYRMQEICASLKNGHSFCGKINYNEEKIFPIRGDYYDDKFYIVVADGEYKDILGAQVISINGIDFEDIEKEYSRIISAENNQRLKGIISSNGFVESEFKYLGIWKENNIFEVKKLNGETEKVNMQTVSYEDYVAIMKDINNYLAYDKRINSIENKKPENAHNQYWYTLDKENRILYFQYNTCFDKNDTKIISPIQDLSFYPDFSDFSKELREFMNANLEAFDKIVVDVSVNGGGNKEHFDSFINFNLGIFNSKKVYAIMSKDTFSAGVLAVNTLVEKCNATMIGEETGGSIEMYAVEYKKSENLPIWFANGKHYVDVLKYAGKNSSDNMRGAIPDIKVTKTIDDIINGVNPYYQAVINN